MIYLIFFLVFLFVFFVFIRPFFSMFGELVEDHDKRTDPVGYANRVKRMNADGWYRESAGWVRRP
jgi:hypothetical protein